MKRTDTLVIACGNPLRGDDGVGLAAAAIVKSWKMPGVKVCAVHQLVPELIDEMKRVDRVLFIDAAMNTADCAYEAYIVEPKKSRRPLGHHETPANLLAMLRDLEGREPDTWLVTISAFSLDHGEEMTEVARDHMHEALAWIRAWLDEPLCMKNAEFSV